MRLFYSHASPYARKALVVLHEAGLAGKAELIAGSGSPLDDGQAPIAQNPLGKVPALELADGRSLYDSRVICQYLDALGQGGLYGQGERRWDCLTLEATADGILDAALLIIYEGRLRPVELHYAPWLDGQWRKVARSLDLIETKWLHHLMGEIDIGQIALGCALGYLDLRFDARNWRADHPQLAAWYATFSQRDSMLKTAPPAA